MSQNKEAPYLPPELWGEIRSHLTLGFDKVALQRVCKAAYAAHKGTVCGTLERTLLCAMRAQWVFDEDKPLRLPDPWRYERHPNILPLGLEFLRVLALLDGVLNVTADRVTARIYENGVIRVTIRYEFMRLVNGKFFDRVEITAWDLHSWQALATHPDDIFYHTRYFAAPRCIDLAWWVVQKVTGLETAALCLRSPTPGTSHRT